MKLFLFSIRLPNGHERSKLFGDKEQLSVVIIPNAWDTYTDEQQRSEVANTVSDFTKLKYYPTVLDSVTTSDKQRRDMLLSCDFVWVMGGNSFYLNYAVHKTGFDKLLKEALEKGVVYGGASAGAIIVCPTLHGVENADDPDEAPQVIWDGLGFVDFGIVPHWGMEKYAEKLEKVADEMRQYTAQIITLTNEQAVVVIDGKVSIGRSG